MTAARLLALSAVAVAAVATARPDPAPPPTFAKDVAPILFAHCASCHRPGEVGPFPLLTYADAKKRAGQIARLAEDKVMPPWKPAAGADTFKDARVLPPGAAATLAAWAAAGAPEGNPRDLPPAPAFPAGWHLGPPDLVLEVARPYAVPAEGPDVYVHFVLPLGLTREKYVKAVQVLPGNRRAAHHGVPMLDTSGTARRLAAKHGGGHYPNFGGPGFLPRGFLPGYAPGQVTRLDPADDRGFTLAPGTDLVLQMHYHPTGKVEHDRPRVGLYFTDRKPARNVAVVALANNDIDIPAGAKGFKRADSFTLPVDFEARDVWAHMHLIGRTVAAWAELPDGSRKGLLDIPDWDFNWQDSYRYAAPFVLPRGTVVRAEWTWDNTADNPRNPHAPPRRVTHGEGSADEMTGLILGGVTARPRDEGPLWVSLLGHYLKVEGDAAAARRRRGMEPAPGR